MNTTTLERRLLSIMPCGYGHWRIQYTHKGQVKSYVTTDVCAVDRVRDGRDNGRVCRQFYTYRQALCALLRVGH